jgi:hypothetical protein
MQRIAVALMRADKRQAKAERQARRTTILRNPLA